MRRWWWMGCALFAGPLWAQPAQDSLWEAGVGLAVTSWPDYRGSDEGHTYILPIPYLVYRGSWLKIDRSGARGDLARSRNFVLDVSANLGPPAASEDNSARRGMPDLDATIELGPSVRWRWYESDDGVRSLTLHLPVRAAIATDFSKADRIGWLLSPQVTYDHDVAGGWKLSASFGPLYAAERYHDYYYAVPARFAAPGREAYDAKGGYSGLRMTFTATRRFARWWVGAFLRYDNLRGAVFDDSPLVRTEHSVMGGIALSRIVARSRQPEKDPGGIAAP